MSCLALLSILCIASLLCVLCIAFFASFFALFFTSSLALSLILSLVLSLIRFPCLLKYSRFAFSFLYIVSLDKQTYIELVTNQYRCFVDLV